MNVRRTQDTLSEHAAEVAESAFYRSWFPTSSSEESGLRKKFANAQ